jgi:uncharacterized protein
VKRRELYLENRESSARAISNVATHHTAFIGRARKGPFEPTRISSFHEFESRYGGLWVKSTLSYSVHQYFQNGGKVALVLRQRAREEFTASLERLEKSDEKFNLLCFPFAERESIDEDYYYDVIIPSALALCERRRAIFIIDPPLSWDTAEKAERGRRRMGRQKVGAVYFPRIGFDGALTKKGTRFFPPSGAIAGVFGRTDVARGVWKAPAGNEAVVRGAKNLQVEITHRQQDTLNPAGLNCIRRFDNRFVVWGSRTLASDDAEWKYVSMIRLAMFIEESVKEGTQWVVFEANNDTLWSRIIQQVSSFLHGLFREGALQGSKSEQAYFVKCGLDNTMTANDINNGIINIQVGFAPLKPAEFIVLKITQIAKAKKSEKVKRKRI